MYRCELCIQSSDVLVQAPLMYQFTNLQLVEPLYNNVEYLSIISSSPDTITQLQNLAEKLFLYQNDHFHQLVDLTNYLSQAGGEHFAVDVATANDTLFLNSKDRNFINLNISEHTLFQNNYATRYMKFAKMIPAKSSPDYETRYTLKVKLDPSAKYHKDLLYLIKKVFSDSKVEIVLDMELPFALQRISPKIKQIEISANSNLEPLNYAYIDPEQSMDYYEYFCMLHINGFPDRNDEHVKLTSMYVPPEGAFKEKTYDFPLYLTAASNINPLVLPLVANTEEWISLLARTPYENLLITKSNNESYIWKISYLSRNVKFR